MVNPLIEHADSLVAIALAHRETVTKIVVAHDTVVRVASPSLGMGMASLGILAQVLVAVLAVLGGALVQKYFKDRDERRAAEDAARAEKGIRDQIAIGISSIIDRLRPVRDQIERHEGVLPMAIQEITRRVRSFEALLPRLLQLHDEAHVTRVYLWFSLVEWLPDDLELLAGGNRHRGGLPEPMPLDPMLVRLHEALGPPERTRGETALRRVDQVLAQGQKLGVALDIYEAGDEIIPILTSRRELGDSGVPAPPGPTGVGNPHGDESEDR
jgi:hypothetical protein